MRTPEDIATDPDALIRVATVASVDLAQGTCTVMLDATDGVETHGLRWVHPRMGETKVWCPPTVGEQVLVLCPGGEIGAALVLGGIHSNANPPPIDEPVPLIRFSDGASLSYDPQAHELLLQLPGGATTVLVSDGGIDLVGDVAITGDCAVSGTLTAQNDVIGGGKSLKTHVHGGVAAGGSQTGAPV
jgi:phage baseplate assembly protein V